MSLRQRPVSAESSFSDSSKKGSVQRPSPAPPAPPAPSKSPRALWVLLAALGLSALLFFASNLSSFATGGSTDYLAPYALCSSEPSKVYTVDAQNTQTQCILVDGGYISKTGTLGVSFEMLGVLLVYRIFYSGGSIALGK